MKPGDKSRGALHPGDLIEWCYTSDGEIVVPHEKLWSSIEERYVPIGGIHLLISRAEGVLTWLTLGALGKGLLRAREDDIRRFRGRLHGPAVTPRARG